MQKAIHRIRQDAGTGIRSVIWMIGAVVSCSSLLAQTNEELFREYQFNFSLPGARANALGGAFIGLSDDATSSFTNPAGLAFLRDPAVTVEFRDRQLDSRLGQISGNTNFSFEQQGSRTSDISFISLNYRIGTWYLGLFRYRYLDEVQQRDFVSRSLSNGTETISAIDVMLDLEGTVHGLGVARRFKNTKFGATLNYADLNAKTAYTREQVEIRPEISERFYNSSILDQDRDWSYSLGFLHEPTDRFSWGLVYRRSPRFQLTEAVQESDSGQIIRIANFSVPFVVPDVVGTGIRYRPMNQLSILFDYQHIAYSQIIKDGFTIVDSPSTDRIEDYTIDDINEFHLGAEWLIPWENDVWAIRAGFFQNPSHLVRYVGNDPIQDTLFSRSRTQDENHITLGIGWVHRNRIQLDVSGNWWPEGQELTASLIWRKK